MRKILVELGGGTRRSRVGRRPLSRAAALGFICTLIACDAEPTGPVPPEQPAVELLLKRTVSYFADQPELYQVGEYSYDEDGRLERFDHISTSTGEPHNTIRKNYLYAEADGRPEGHNSFVRLDDDSWRLSRTVRYGYHGSPVPVEVRLEDVDEGTGQVVVEVWGLGYDELGQLNEIRRGPVTETFTYDRNGDITRVHTDDLRFGVFIETLTYSGAWNPLAGFPPLHGASSSILLPGTYSLHLSCGFETRVEGQGTTARATATVETNAHGYPTRWEITFWNTAHPAEKMTAVTEYEY